MTTEVDPVNIKKTQDLLSKYIKKPPLTEKLLSKPPFRFLHDIIKSIIKETKFLDGLYTDNELDSEKVKDKESKIAFLDKLLSALKLIDGTKLTAKSAKIVAGLEVNKTLEVLQTIGWALDNNTDTSSIVERIVKRKSNAQSTKEKDKKSDNLKKDVNKLSVNPERGNAEQQETNEPIAATKPINQKETPMKGQNINTKSKTEKVIQKKHPVPSKATSNSTKESSLKSSRNVISKKDVTDKVKSELKTKHEAQSKEKSGQSTVRSSSNQAKQNQKEKLAKSNSQNQIEIQKPSILEKMPTDNEITDENPKIKSRQEDNPKDLPDNNISAAERISDKQKTDVLHTELKQEADSKLESVAENKVATLNETRQLENENINETVDSNSSKDAINKDADGKEKIKDDAKSAKKFKKVKEVPSTPRPTSARPGSRKSQKNSAELKDSLPKDNTKPAILPHATPSPWPPPPVQQDSVRRDSFDSKKVPSARPKTATRPPSARPGAPRVRDRGEVPVAEEIRTPVAAVNVIEDTTDQVQDDKDDLIILEESTQPPEIQLMENFTPPINDANQGQLVNQILETQKQLEHDVKDNVSQPSKRLEIEWEAGRTKEKDMVTKEINKICNSIQTLTSATNPLSKLIDYLQEDVDEMHRELQHWRQENENLRKQYQSEFDKKFDFSQDSTGNVSTKNLCDPEDLKTDILKRRLKEDGLGKTSLEPLKKQLEEVDNNIQMEYQHLMRIKAAIIANDDKIFRLATNINTNAKQLTGNSRTFR